MHDLPELILERTFQAPRELVWRTWTDPELLARWHAQAGKIASAEGRQEEAVASYGRAVDVLAND